MAIGEYLNTAEAADELGVSPVRVRQFYAQGRLRGVKLNNGLFFHQREVAKFRKSPRKNGRPKNS